LTTKLVDKDMDVIGKEKIFQ